MAFYVRRAWWLALLLAGWCEGTGALLAQSSANGGSKATEQLPPPKTVPAGPSTGLLEAQVLPIDLTSALRLAGVQNPQILLAQQRVEEAVAVRQLAAAQLL